MYPFTKPTGGLYVGKKLLCRPQVARLDVGLPVRTVFLSDLHARENALSMIDTVLDLVAELQPRLLLLGGDYAEGHEPAVRFFRCLGKTLPDVPKFAVAGNNDDFFFENDHARLRALMAENGVRFLDNELARLDIDGHALEIVGVSDAYYFEPSAKGLFSAEKGVYRVLLTHAPHTFLLEQAAPDLLLAGHTHGGQINFLGLTCYSVRGYEGKYHFTHIAGVRQFGNTTALVSNGIGYSKFAIRLGARPEIHLFDR